MGFDKAKVLRAAEKHLSQGKIPSAIKEYRKIVEHDADDFTTLNMLGDLYGRTNDKEEATKCFTRIAEYYREQGFALKAIAMFKKIDRLNPGTPEIASKLAPLYEMQGLVVEARAHYLVVADAYTRAGQSKKALEVLRKIADLDPNNIDVRLKLAEGYLREGFQRDAAAAYTEAGGYLLARGAHERSLDAYSKALAIIPDDRTALSGILTAHIELGTADDAAEILERALVDQPDDVELLSMLAHAYVEAEDAKAAERATARLVARESSSYQRFLEVARLYLKEGDTGSTVRLVYHVAEQMLANNEEEKLVELLDEILARNPEQVDALRLLVRVYTWQHDEEKMRGALERLAEASEAAGLADMERFALSQLVRLSPSEPRHLERLQALGGSPEATGGDYQSASPEASAQEVPTFESFAMVQDEAPVATPAADAVAQFEWNSVAPQPDASSSFADLNDFTDAIDANSGAQTNEAAPTSGFQEFDFSTAIIEGAGAKVDEGAPATPAGAEVRREAMLRQELESVDFYIAQGYTDIASDTLDMLERQFGAHAEIDSRRARVKAGAAAASPSPTTEAAPVQSVEFKGFNLYDVAAEESTQAEATEEIDAAFMQLEATPADASQTAQPHAPVPSSAPPTAQPKAGIDPGLAAIFDEFRTAVEEEEALPSDGDYETHYNLGLAYKDMDLLDEAIEEFQMAAGMVAPQDGTPRYLQCCNLLGHCFMQKGMPRLAVMWFKKGLEAPGHTEDEYQALRFELGMAYEQMGDLDSAITVFTEVYGINVSYRGVADKLRDLQAQRATK
jgi:tetratricopeptide (TPR) repeat protein